MKIHAIITDFNPNHKYKIVKVQNGLGETWYSIKRVGFLWDSWYRKYYVTNYGFAPFVPKFDSEAAAHSHLESEKEQYCLEIRRNKITITDCKHKF